MFRTAQNPVTCRGLTGAQRVSYLASLLNYFSAAQRDVRDSEPRGLLVEFCYVVLPEQRLSTSDELSTIPARIQVARAS